MPVLTAPVLTVPVVNVAVVGAGPAGMAAALAAAERGCDVDLIDAAPAVGGQIFRQSLIGGDARVPERLRAVVGHPRIRHLAGTTVWHAERGEDGGFVLRLTGPDGQRAASLRAGAVVVATGATELTLPFPGWQLPGVTTAGAAQALLKSQRVTFGRRVIVAGSGPFLLPVAAGLAAAGVRVVAVLEATRARMALPWGARVAGHPGKLREAAEYATTLARHRVPVRTGQAVIRCDGAGRVEQATVARVERDWRPVAGSERVVAVDAVHVSFGFSPALELSRVLGCADVQHPERPTAAVSHDGDQATSVPGVFAAGEVTGIGGAEVAELEGYLAGASAARYLGRPDGSLAAAGPSPRRVRARLGRARRFAAVLDRAYPFRAGWLDWLDPGTVVCRCEETPWAAIGRAVEAGAGSLRSVKGLTRCGMGYCQGRVCGPVLQHAVATATGRPLAEAGDLHGRPLLAPVTLEEIAGG